MYVIDIFAAFYIHEKIVVANITKIKHSRIKDDLQYTSHNYMNLYMYEFLIYINL